MDAAPSARYPGVVGREAELALLHTALEHEDMRFVEVSGEPGIGKTALLDELGEIARSQGRLVLNGRAGKDEPGAPLGVFVDALDPHLRSTDPVLLEEIDSGDLEQLATVFPALRRFRAGTDEYERRERNHVHRAVRSLLIRLAAGRGLALVLDDVHRADDASSDLIASLLRRPLEARALIAVSVRPAQTPAALRTTLGQALRTDTTTRIALAPITIDDARKLLPNALPGFMAPPLHRESGGNPFYLEQLARAATASGRPARVGPLSGDDLPRAVTQSIAEETTPLSSAARLLVQGASVLHDPFDPSEAATAAELDEREMLAALDELVDADLVRVTDVPRRFRFRHPLVRRAIYASTEPGWRLEAHRRAAEQLRRLGAGPAARAHHVELLALPGDTEAVDILVEAAADVAARDPATAARWLDVAARLVPKEGLGGQRRSEILVLLGAALVATGHFGRAHDLLQEVLGEMPADDPMRPYVVADCATTERLLGRHAEGRARLSAALGPGRETAAAAVRLRFELTALATGGTDFEELRRLASTTSADAEAIGDDATAAAAVAALAIGEHALQRWDAAEARRTEATHRAAALGDAEASTRLEVMLFLGWAAWFAGRAEDARTAFARGLEIARNRGQVTLLVDLMVGCVVSLGVVGRVTEGVELADAAVEEAETIGNGYSLAWALYAQCSALEPTARLDAAVAAGARAMDAATDRGGELLRSCCGYACAAALLASGASDRARSVLLESHGGDALPSCMPGRRPASYELLASAELAAGRVDEA
ncbi:MAG: AAA family ATPase, partial [Patulibacter sp.]